MAHTDTPHSWADARSLFEAVAELDAAEREVAFARHAHRPELVLEVRSLLEWDSRPGPFLDSPVVAPRDLPGDPLVGQSLGPWLLVQVLGAGGMGVVYKAERADDSFTRHAAVKVIGHGADAADVVERFRRERQTLADLDHRNIARLLDGGSTPSGQPYFVMEYVDGLRLDTYCDQRRLGIKDRLELFGRVCNGVRYAHENLVVHRDIKPDNVLVTSDGTPKLLDFGVARLVSRHTVADDPSGLAATWIITPDFSSPEQLAGRTAGTAGDVYSLGVVLFVLLTGERPYTLHGVPPRELGQAVAKVEIPLASAVAERNPGADQRAAVRGTTPAMLARTLRGDLDAIVSRALDRDVTRRYSSVADLLADIQAHHHRRPVSARPPSAGYVAGLFITRHLKALAALAVVVAVVLAGVAAVLWQARIAATERERAERRFNEVRQMANTFMFDVNDTMANVPGTMPTRQLIVSTTIAYLDNLAREAAGDASLQQELARAWARVGDVQGNPTTANMGDTAGAMRSYQRAIDLAESARSAAPDSLDAERALAIAHRGMADVLAWSGDKARALAESEASTGLYETIAAHPSSRFEDRVEAAVAAVKLGDLLGNPNLPNLNRRDAAAAKFTAALDRLRTLNASTPGDLRVERFIGLTLERLGTLHEADQRWLDAEHAYRESFERRRALAEREPAHRNIQRDLAIAFEKLGKIERATRGPGAGIANLRGALAQFERLATADPADVNAARSVAVSREVLALALADASGRTEARDLFAAALATHRGLAARDTGNAQARCDAARLLEFLGDATGVAGGGPKACEHWGESAAIIAALQRAGTPACNTGGSGPAGLAAKLKTCP